jgi:hypothetical protein
MPGTRVRLKSKPCNFKNLLLIVHLEEERTIEQTTVRLVGVRDSMKYKLIMF